MSPPAAAANRKYKSTIPTLLSHALLISHPLTVSEIEEKIYDIKEEVCRHLSAHNPGLDSEGKDWLTELLAWESLFPEAKHQFPGIRPESTIKPRPRPRPSSQGTSGLPFCECCSCMGYPQGDLRCPFIRVKKCGKEGHGEFKYRIGSVDEGVCPSCEREGEGWVVIDKKAKGKGKVGVIENGWLLVEGGEEGK